MSPRYWPAFVAQFALSLLATGCVTGGSDAGVQGAADDAGLAQPPLTADAAAPGANPPLPDGAVYPHGTQRASGSLRLDGVTSDDVAIYVDVASNVAYALSLKGGSTPVSLGAVADGVPAIVTGTVVILGTSADPNGVGSTSVWVTNGAAPAPLAYATLVGRPTSFAVSSDGHQVVFLDTVNATTMTASIVAARTDGTERSTLVAEVPLSEDTCAPRLGFGGSTFAVTAFCSASPDDSGAPDGNRATVSTYAAAGGWTQATLASGVRAAFAVDPGASRVVVQGPAGTQSFPIAGGVSTTLDPAGALGEQTSSPGLFSADGARLFYTRNDGTLTVAHLDTPLPPTALSAPGEFGDLLGLSPDGAHVVGASGGDASAGVSLLLADTSMPGAIVPLSAEGNIGLAGDLFTRDSSHVLYTVAQGKETVLDLVPVDGGAPTTLGEAAFQAFAVGGGLVVYGANFRPTVNHGEAASDLFEGNAASGSPPTLLVTQADPRFAFNAGRSALVYTWSYEPGASVGLWTLDLDAP